MRTRTSPVRLAILALPVAAGICGMHYTGMAALEVVPAVSYDRILIFASILIAFSGACVALAIGQGYFAGMPVTRAWRLPLEAVVMGLAISCMHYTGMVAVQLPETLHFQSGDGWVLGTSGIVLGIAVGCLVIVAANLAPALLYPDVSPLPNGWAGVTFGFTIKQ